MVKIGNTSCSHGSFHGQKWSEKLGNNDETMGQLPTRLVEIFINYFCIFKEIYVEQSFM